MEYVILSITNTQYMKQNGNIRLNSFYIYKVEHQKNFNRVFVYIVDKYEM